MTKPDNPYTPGTVIHDLFEGDWTGYTRQQIAEALFSTDNTVNDYIAKIKRRTGYTVPYARLRSNGKPFCKISTERAAHNPNRPANPYTPGSGVWNLFEGDFAALTREQIADVLGIEAETVSAYFVRIKRDTGWDVPHMRSGRRKA